MHVYIEKINRYDFDQIRSFLQETAEKIDLWSQLNDKTNILIKPNMLGPYAPEKAVTTNPVVIKAMISLLQEKGKHVVVGDSPGGSLPVQVTWKATGIQALCEEMNVPLVNFSNGGVEQISFNSYNFTISKHFLEADAVINMAKYKTHSLMYYTGAIKNLYGLIPGLKKSDYHKEYPDYDNFSGVLKSLYQIAKDKIVLNIVDGIQGMEGQGPSAGDRRDFGVLFASQSASALDYQAAGMMGFKSRQLAYIHDSLILDGLNETMIEVDSQWKNFVFEHVKHKKIGLLVKLISKSPKFLHNLFKKMYTYYPEITENCKLCYVCQKSCPVKAISFDKTANKLVIDKSACIKCMCCHELCPYHAVDIKKSALAKLLVK